MLDTFANNAYMKFRFAIIQAAAHHHPGILIIESFKEVDGTFPRRRSLFTWFFRNLLKFNMLFQYLFAETEKLNYLKHAESSQKLQSVSSQ